jgi:hypothetical protein
VIAVGSCTDLATKPEVAAKIDKSEKPEIVQASAATAVPIVAGILANYADEAAAIGREALLLARQGLSLAKIALGQIAKVLSGLANVLSLIGLMATQAQLLILNNRVNQLTKDVRHAEGVATGATWRAEQAIRTGNAATATANTAIGKSNEAVNTANAIANQANQALIIANAASQEANKASIAASSARHEASQANRAADYAVTVANTATGRANTAITQSNQAKTEANAATVKANTAISEANKNAQELASLRAEVAQLKLLLAAKDAGLIGLQAAISAVEAQVETKEDKYIVRRVEKAAITNASDIRDLNGHLVGLPSVIGKTVDIKAATITKSFDGKMADLEERTKGGVGSGGISLQGAKDAVFGDLFGNTKVNSQLKDVIGTEVSTQTRALEKVNTEQYNDIRDRISAIPGIVTGVVTAGMVTTLSPIGAGVRTTVAQTAPAVLSSAAAAGVCSTTKPGGCMNNMNSNQTDKIRDVINAAGTAASAANNALLLRMQGILNTINATTKTIQSSTDVIQKAVTHASHGLQAIQKFASTAWNSTLADKALNVINTGLNIHNAVMLSNNIGRSVAYIANNVLASFGITDATTGDAIDVGALVQRKLNSVLNNVLGVTQANTLRRQLAQYNRIYQAGANVLYSVRAIMDSTYDIAETTGENVSQIGNALKKAGAVRENAYKLMPTDFRSTSRVQRRLEKLGNAADTIEQISSDALDVTQEVKEMKSNQKEFNDELEKAITEQSKVDDSKKKDAISNPEHKPEDEIRTLPKEG